MRARRGSRRRRPIVRDGDGRLCGVLVALLSFAVAAGVLIVLPGPDTTVVLRAIAHGGRGTAARTAAGVCCGLVVWLVVAVAGLSALLAASRTGYEALKIGGALYLGWLGLRTLWTLRRGSATPHGVEPDTEPAPRGNIRRGGFVLGLATDVLNPKVGVFFVTFLPQFIPHHAPVTAYTLLLGALYIAGTAAWFALLVRLAARLGRWLRRPATQRWMQRITGVALLGFAVGMVAESA
jgi:threonine/homoserine/homoserine lactone efflux protein